MLEIIALVFFIGFIIGVVAFARGLENRGRYAKAHMLDKCYRNELIRNHTTGYKG